MDPNKLVNRLGLLDLYKTTILKLEFYNRMPNFQKFIADLVPEYTQEHVLRYLDFVKFEDLKEAYDMEVFLKNFDPTPKESTKKLIESLYEAILESEKVKEASEDLEPTEN